MKTIHLTDAEHEAVRRAVAGLATSNPHLATALSKLDRGTDQVRLELVLTPAGQPARPVFSGLAARWLPTFPKLIAAAVKRGGIVTVYVDGDPVDASKLKPHQPLTCLGDS